VTGVLCAIVAVSAAAVPEAVRQVALPLSGQSIRIDATPVPLHPQDPSVVAVGNFFYAGGLMVTSKDTNRLHELSDLVIRDDGRMTAVGDDGILFNARLVLDDHERLVGLTDGRIAPLIGPDGKPLTGTAGDAEGLALLRNGDLLVSFERQARILLYPARGGRPHVVSSPRTRFASNEGMEGLDAMPDIGPDAYMVGAEDTGKTWRCRLAAGCQPGPTLEKPEGFGLVSLTRLPDRKTAYLIRAYDPARGPRVSLRILASDRVLEEMNLARPLTVDNFEGLASTPTRNGRRRFYLVSDDNAAADQRTLLLAFDWRPK
jgi:hypothetical protein